MKKKEKNPNLQALLDRAPPMRYTSHLHRSSTLERAEKNRARSKRPNKTKNQNKKNKKTKLKENYNLTHSRE
jgi:hypothetical protein